MLTFLVCGANQEKREEKIKKLIAGKKPKILDSDPDIFHVTSENEIGVEEIRHLKYWFSFKAFKAPPKIAVINQAKALSEEAQAVLGQLIDQEEENNLLIMAAPNTESLSPSITGRCQIISLAPETEIGLSSGEIIIEKTLADEIVNLSLGERLKLSEQYKNREDALKFCQKQLTYWHNLFLKNPNQENLTLCGLLQKTIRLLNSNVNPRLTIDILLISYPLK